MKEEWRRATRGLGIRLMLTSSDEKKKPIHCSISKLLPAGPYESLLLLSSFMIRLTASKKPKTRLEKNQKKFL
jgi:hypothetical protein